MGVSDLGMDAPISAGMRVVVRGMEWFVTKVETNATGNRAVSCTGISPLVRDYDAVFLDDLDRIEPVDPVHTTFVPDTSPRAAQSRLFIESLLRATAPTDRAIHVGNKAAMDSLPYQLVPAEQALNQPRQRILIADAVGLGKTLEAGILMSELIKRRKGRRILVVTAKSMMLQFQKEMWERFTIPLISLDSSRIQRIREDIPANANPFSYYDKVIVSIDTLKRDIQYGAALDASYWDIIVIDEAQNVADRAINGRHAQRTKLAKRLASHSDTLIMLSATPHDGRARSFASLMNMLDPTTLPDPEHYDKEAVKHLYVRRFKKDVLSDVSGSFPERRVTQECCQASPAEEEAFDCLTGLHLAMDTRRHTNAALFTTLLEKSLFSSPAACIATINERIKRLSNKHDSVADGDIEQLETLRTSLDRIGPDQFSRYRQLLHLLNSDSYGWLHGSDADDRIVIFTERIETKRWLVEHLGKDLKLPKKAVASMDGSMTDLEQQRIVEDFGTKSSPIRILVASDVASEGLNLHYLCHRLIHFDTPWSLMVFQQRNGRIDRYGQRQRPDIRFMTIKSCNEKINGDARILEILREKENQAHNDIGDPSLLMGKFNIEDEEAVVSRSIESHISAEDFANSLSDVTEDIDRNDDDFDVMAYFGLTQDDDAKPVADSAGDGDVAIPSSPYFDDSRITGDSPSLMSDFDYVYEGLSCEQFQQSAGLKARSVLHDGHGIKVQFNSDSSLRAWLRRHVPDTQILRDDVAEWNDDAQYCLNQSHTLTAQINDEQWSRTQYLWELNPITEWIGLKASSLLYERGQAPIIGVNNVANGGCMQPGETIVLISGMIANEQASPVIDEWFGMDYLGGVYRGVLPLSEVWKRTGYRGRKAPGTGVRRYVNRNEDTPDDIRIRQTEDLLPEAVNRAGAYLDERRNEYTNQANKQIDIQLDHIQQWADARKAVLSQYRTGKQDITQVDRIYDEYAGWVKRSLSASGQPVIRIAAAFVNTEQQQETGE